MDKKDIKIKTLNQFLISLITAVIVLFASIAIADLLNEPQRPKGEGSSSSAETPYIEPQPQENSKNQGESEQRTEPNQAIGSVLQDKIEITRKDDTIIINSTLSRLDFRQSLASLLGGQGDQPPDQLEAAKPAESKPEASLEPKQPRKLDIRMQIGELILPEEIVVKQVKALFTYQDDKGSAQDENILAFVQDLRKVLGRDLLGGLIRLDFEGEIEQHGKLSKLTVDLEPADNQRKNIRIHSDNAAAMMQVIGYKNYITGGQYVMHAEWVEEKKLTKSTWKIIGVVQIKNFHLINPPLGARFLGGLFSLRGLYSAVGEKNVFLEKVEFPFKITPKGKEVHCRVFFSPELSFPCQKF